jgi:hypothetical protein
VNVISHGRQERKKKEEGAEGYVSPTQTAPIETPANGGAQKITEKRSETRK